MRQRLADDQPIDAHTMRELVGRAGSCRLNKLARQARQEHDGARADERAAEAEARHGGLPKEVVEAMVELQGRFGSYLRLVRREAEEQALRAVDAARVQAQLAAQRAAEEEAYTIADATAVEEALEALEERHEALTRDRDQLAQQLASAQSRASEQALSISLLERAVSEAREGRAAALAELESTRRQVTELEAAHAEQRDRADGLAGEVARHADEVAALERSLDACREELRTERVRVEQAERLLAAFAARVPAQRDVAVTGDGEAGAEPPPQEVHAEAEVERHTAKNEAMRRPKKSPRRSTAA